MKQDVKEVINVLIKALKENFNDFRGLYLYGSLVEEDNLQEYDIELVAIFDKEDKQKRELIWPLIGKIETDLSVFIDLHPVTMEEFKKRRRVL